MINSFGIKYPSTTIFLDKFPVSFSGTVAVPPKFNITFEQIVDPKGVDQPIPLVNLPDLMFELDVYIADAAPSLSNSPVLMSTHLLSYSGIQARIITQERRVMLTSEGITVPIGKWGKSKEFWKAFSKLPDGADFTSDLKDSWRIMDEAFKLVSKDQFGKSFVSSIEVPNVLGSIVAFSFTGDTRTAVDPEAGLVMFTGPAEWVIGCSRRQASSANGVGMEIIQNGKSIRGPNDLAGQLHDPNMKMTLRKDAPDAEYPPISRGERSDMGDVFVYLPRLFMEHRFDGVIKPSVTFSDRGSVGPIFWHYEASLPPAAGGQLRITLEQVWPTEFKISLPLAPFGSAGAGIQIGCVKFEVAGIHFDGRIDPFEVLFMIGLDVSRLELYFESKLGRVEGHDFNFHHFPEMGFPLDQIADFLLGRVAEKVVNAQAGSTLNVTRFSLADFGLFRGFGSLRDHMAAVGDSSRTTVGVKFV
jgi:hypothetical protein